MASKKLTDGQQRTEEGVRQLLLSSLHAEITIITGPPDITIVEVEGNQKILTSFSKAHGVFKVFSELADLSGVPTKHVIASGAGSVAAGGDISGNINTGRGNVVTPSRTSAPKRNCRITVTAPPEVEVIAEVTDMSGKITFERQK